MKTFFYLIVTLSILFTSSCRKTDNVDIEKQKRNDITQEQEPVEQFKPEPLSKKFKNFRGAYFSISYPENFKVRPSLTFEVKGGYRSAFFKSPDGYVEFYVFGTWHSNENNEIDLKPDIEFLQQSEIKRPNENTEVKYYTYMAKDSSYKRSYMDKMEYGERTILGIKYKNKDAYEYYKDSYLKFKKSLEEYADDPEGR